MKIEMNAVGKLFITADNDVEAYALFKWCNENSLEDGTENIEIDWNKKHYRPLSKLEEKYK